MLKKSLSSLSVVVFGLFITTAPVLAHVAVRPSEVGVGSFQTFTVGVPNEREVATTAVHLVIPEGLNHVSPNIKPGWTISTKMEEGEESEEAEHTKGRVTEISWTGGSIPEGMRDDFLFSAQVPAEPTTLAWKAYQTYSDGTVVEWDLGEGEEQPTKEDGSPDFSKKGPASMTKIVDDLTAETSAETTNESDQLTMWVAYTALAAGLIALALNFRKKSA